jgi:hypothetical protein
MKWGAVYPISQIRWNASTKPIIAGIGSRGMSAPVKCMQAVCIALVARNISRFKAEIELGETYHDRKGPTGSTDRISSDKNTSTFVVVVKRNYSKINETPGDNISEFISSITQVTERVYLFSGNLNHFIHTAFETSDNLYTVGRKIYGGDSRHLEYKSGPIIKPKNTDVLHPLIYLQLSNLKYWLNGILHDVCIKLLPGCLMEWEYSFNYKRIISNYFDNIIRRHFNVEPISHHHVRGASTLLMFRSFMAMEGKV